MIENNQVRMIGMFFKYCNDFQNKKIDQEKFVDMLIVISKQRSICRSYPEISYMVFRLKKEYFIDLSSFFGVSDGKSSLDGLRGTDERLVKLDSKFIDNLNHFERHIRLSFHQRNYTDDKVVDLEKRLKDTSESLDKVDNKLRNSENIINELESKSSRMYSEFVGILGVFTALSFALMGSVQVFGNIFDKVQNVTLGTVGNILVAGGLYLLLIYLIIMTLFIGMKKLFSIRKDDKYIFNRLFTFIIIFVGIALIITGITFVFLA